MFKKIIVIGCPGAGKSCFARRLRDLTGIPLYYLDMLWHKPDKTNISKDEFDKRLEEITRGESWIIDGNYKRTLNTRLAACDTVFFLDYPTELCLEGARKRIGTKREDMPWIEDSFDCEFEQYIKDFSKDNLPVIYELLSKHKDKNIFIFKGREQADTFLYELEKRN